MTKWESAKKSSLLLRSENLKESMVNIIQIGLYIWAIAYAVFRMNPVNNPLDPLSEMNPYYHKNLVGKEKLRRIMVEEAEEDSEEPIRVFYWNDVWPIIQPTLITMLSLILIGLIR